VSPAYNPGGTGFAVIAGMDHPFRGQGPLYLLLLAFLAGFFLGLAAGPAIVAVSGILLLAALGLAGCGGGEATVTDAMVVMDVIDVNNYLGGRHRLDIDAARRVIEKKIGERFGWSAERAAAAIHDLVVINMANALREVSVERGYDPRHFAMFAYGGTLPMFAMQICREIGIRQVIIPNNSSVFSAFGLLTADYVRQYSRTVDWVLGDAGDYQRINAVAAELLEVALEDARKEGFGRESVQIIRSGDFRMDYRHYGREFTIKSMERRS